MNHSQRFTDRVDAYVKARPAYPDAVWTVLAQHCGLTPADGIADIGAGTGLLAQLFLQHGNCVYAVEPNAAMRAAAEARLGGMAHFHSIDGSAEATTLVSASVDFVTAGQAFHWFDRAGARREFTCILKPSGWVVLVYLVYNDHGSAFQVAYETLLQRYGTDYATVPHHTSAKRRCTIFSPPVTAGTQTGPQAIYGLAHLAGALIVPILCPPGRTHPHTYPCWPSCAPCSRFEQHQQHGRIAFLYQTKITYRNRLQESPFDE